MKHLKEVFFNTDPAFIELLGFINYLGWSGTFFLVGIGVFKISQVYVNMFKLMGSLQWSLLFLLFSILQIYSLMNGLNRNVYTKRMILSFINQIMWLFIAFLFVTTPVKGIITFLTPLFGFISMWVFMRLSVLKYAKKKTLDALNSQ